MSLDKDKFFEEFPVEKNFKYSGLNWETLSRIYEDYSDNFEDYERIANDIQEYILALFKKEDVKYRSCFFRTKDPKHLIEKIIRKAGKEQSNNYKDIDEHNYAEKVHDLVGGRVLLLYKEQWKQVFECFDKEFKADNSECRFGEDPIAYAKYGDRDIYENLIHKDHTNKGYRSQHYIVCFRNCYCEIQVRTLAEEVFGEFDHFVKYPYRESNNFLRRYTKSLSDLLDSVDEIISTCVSMGDDGWEYNSTLFQEDKYIDWKNISQQRGENVNEKIPQEKKVEESIPKKISMLDYSKKVYLKK